MPHSPKENSPDLWLPEIPWPQPDGHKYDRGHAVVIGGSMAMTGAARMAAYAALRAGAGLVTVVCPASALPVYAASLTAVMTKPYNHLDEFTTFLADHKHGILIGPGAGVGEDTREKTLAILATDLPIVLDADALTSFADMPDSLFNAIEKRTSPTILTPHEGEFTQLFGAIDNRVTAAKNAAIKSHAIIVLKGSETIITTPDNSTVINTHASPTLATAGSGDVLAGIILGLISAGMPAFHAACAATWIHGECAQCFGVGLIAEDLIDQLPDTLQQLQQRSFTE